MTMGHIQDAGPGTAAGRHTGALVRTLVGTTAFMLVEVIGGLWTGSLALLADAAHMLTDVGGLGLALFAIWMAAKPPTADKTYGYYRVEILAALINAVVLFVIAIAILVEAYRRFWAPPEVLGGPMLVIAVIGLGVNLVGLWFLRRGSGESLNVHGAYLEVLGDALGSVGVIVAALIVLLTGWYPADPLISVGIGLFILPRTWGVLRQAVNVLLEGTPAHIDVRALEAAMREVPGVRRVHDLHVWTLTSGKDAMSAHVVVDGVAEGDRLTRTLHDLLHERFGVEHTTIQIETEPLVQIGVPNERPSGHGNAPPPADRP
jgi:cobalt-zinc-cadmium efflux system protein